MSTPETPSTVKVHQETRDSPRTPRSLCLTDRKASSPRARDEAGIYSTRRGRSLGRSLSSGSSSTSSSPSKATASSSKKYSFQFARNQDAHIQRDLSPSRSEESDLNLDDSASQLKRWRKQRPQEPRAESESKPRISRRALTERDRCEQRLKQRRRSDFAAKKTARLEREENQQSQQWTQISDRKQKPDHEHSRRTSQSV